MTAIAQGGKLPFPEFVCKLLLLLVAEGPPGREPGALELVAVARTEESETAAAEDEAAAADEEAAWRAMIESGNRVWMAVNVAWGVARWVSAPWETTRKYIG